MARPVCAHSKTVVDYRALFQRDIAETVADPTEVDSEITFLISTLSARS